MLPLPHHLPPALAHLHALRWDRHNLNSPRGHSRFTARRSAVPCHLEATLHTSVPTTYSSTTTTSDPSIDDEELPGWSNASSTHSVPIPLHMLLAIEFDSMEAGTERRLSTNTDRNWRPNLLRYSRHPSSWGHGIHLFNYLSQQNSLAVCSPIPHTMYYTRYAVGTPVDLTCIPLRFVAAPTPPLALSRQSPNSSIATLVQSTAVLHPFRQSFREENNRSSSILCSCLICSSFPVRLAIPYSSYQPTTTYGLESVPRFTSACLFTTSTPRIERHRPFTLPP